MNLTIKPTSVSGTVTAPPSKSYMQRAIALAVLSHNPTIISNLSDCNDCRAAIGVARNLGCAVEQTADELRIVPPANGLAGNHLHCGESGLALRMFTPVASLLGNRVELTGEGSLTQRPVGFMEDTLRQLGVDVQTNSGLLPIAVKGPMQGGKAIVDGSVSSQFLTGLLIALPTLKNDTVLTVNNLTSRPYIDMTLQIMRDFGVSVENADYEQFTIKGGQQYANAKYRVEGDWSGAAAFIVAAAIAGTLKINGLNPQSAQADRAIIDVLRLAGTKFAFDAYNCLIVNKNDNLQPFNFDATNCPDLFPVLAALAANCKGTSAIAGVHRLTHKESNRAEAIRRELGKLGISIDFEGDKMIVVGGPIGGGAASACNDHRMAMSLALCALNASGAVTIEGTECVGKSYPEFFDDLESVVNKA